MMCLYIECKMGAAGDMLMSALYELLSDGQKEEYIDTMNRLFSDTVTITPETGTKCGITGTHMRVRVHGEEELPNTVNSAAAHDPEKHDHHHHEHHSYAHGCKSDASCDEAHAHHHHEHHSYAHGCKSDASCDEAHAHHHHEHHSYTAILAQISQLPLPARVISDASIVYRLIGEAEARVHNTPIEQIHFHEVGSLDALADVVGCCLLFHMIGAKEVYASPIHVGNGTVHCAHGVLPVPAPATAELLKGIPFYTGDVDSELCTPTGAAILKHFVTSFEPMPPIKADQIGVGLGTKDFRIANCVRIFCGSREEDDVICDLSCNLDDMTGEDLGYCMELLFDAGALDVFYEPIQMKKNRPGILLHCFCAPTEKETFLRLLLTHTTTRGVRYQMTARARLDSRTEELTTPFGTVRNKISFGHGVEKSKYELEDLKKIAKETNVSLASLRKQLP